MNALVGSWELVCRAINRNHHHHNVVCKEQNENRRTHNLHVYVCVQQMNVSNSGGRWPEAN